MIDLTKVTEHVPDPLVDLIVQVLEDAAFEPDEQAGTMYCSDSNRAIDPWEFAKSIREVLGVSK